MNETIMELKQVLDNMATLNGGRPYWSARQILDLVGYNVSHDWSLYVSRGPIAKMINDCQLSGYATPESIRMSQIGITPTGGQREYVVEDFLLDKHQCNLLLINCDGRKKYVAEAHAYFSESAIEIEALAAQNPNMRPMRTSQAYEARENVRSLQKLMYKDIARCDNYNKNSFGIMQSKGDQAFLGSTTAEFKDQHNIPQDAPLRDYLDPSLLYASISAFLMTHTYATMNNVTDINDLIMNHVATNDKLR